MPGVTLRHNFLCIIQKDSGTAEVRPSWIRKLQQKQEGGKKQKETEAKQENKEKGKQEVKKKPQGNTTKKKPAPGKDSGLKKQSNAKAEIEEKERVGEERAADGKGSLILFYVWTSRTYCNVVNCCVCFRVNCVHCRHPSI